MSDLISRSGLYMNDLIRRKDVLVLFPTNDCSDKMVGLYERVLDIPTAYDVEKVVEEIEKESVSIWDDDLETNIRVVDKRVAMQAIRKGGAE